MRLIKQLKFRWNQVLKIDINWFEYPDSKEVNDMKEHPRIELRPDVMFGKPVIKNTRITVEHILRKLASGMTFDEIISDHPNLTHKDIFAA